MEINELLDILSTYPNKFFITTEDLSDDIKDELLKFKTALQEKFGESLFRLRSLYTVTDASLSTKKNIVNELLISNRLSPLIKNEDIKIFNTGIIPSATNALIASFYRLYSEIPDLMKDKSFIDADNELSVELRGYMANVISEYTNKWNREYKFCFLQDIYATDTVSRIKNDMIKNSLNTISDISKNGSLRIKTVADEIFKIKNTWVDTLIDNTISKIDYLKYRSNGEFLNKDYSTIASNVILTTFILSHTIGELVNEYCNNVSDYNQEIISYLDQLKCSQGV